MVIKIHIQLKVKIQKILKDDYQICLAILVSLQGILICMHLLKEDKITSKNLIALVLNSIYIDIKAIKMETGESMSYG